jgi:hypothetical protein
LNNLRAALRRNNADVEAFFVEEAFCDSSIPGGVPAKRNKVERNTTFVNVGVAP